MRSPIFRLVSLAAVLALAGCGEGRDSLPNVNVSVVHAAPSYMTIDFLREQARETQLSYSTGSRHSFDADQFDFNLDVTPPAGRQRVTTFSQTLAANNDYYFVLTDTGEAIEPVVIEEPAFAADADDSEFTVYHAAAALGAVDVYLEAPGADVAAARPIGGIGYQEQIDAATHSPGDYRITLTEPGTPGNVLYRSPTFAAAAGQDNLLVISDGAGQTRAAANVVRVGTATQGTLPDITTSPALRVINGANDRESKDILIDGDTFIAELPFATAVDYQPLGRSEHDLTVTPAGNPGVLELEETFTTSGARYYTYYFAGSDSAGLSGDLAEDDLRPINDTARVRLVNLAAQFERLQVLLVEPDASLADAEPQIDLGAPQLSQLTSFPPGEYDLALRETSSENIVAGPVPITFNERGIYTVVAVDGTDTASAEFLLLDDLQ